MQLKLLVDIDGVLGNFPNQFVKYVEALGYTCDRDFSTYNITSWIQHVNSKHVTNDIMKDKSFWLSMPTLKNAYEGLQFLNNNYDLIIATTPWDDGNKLDKLTWIKTNFPFIKESQIVFSSDKWNLDGDIIIEDKPETLRNCFNNKITIKYLWNYNQYIESDFTLTNWNQIETILSQIEELLYEGGN